VATWNELLTKFAEKSNDRVREQWLKDEMQRALASIGTLRGERNVILYGSAFLQKPLAPAYLTSITHEDLDGFMATVHGTDPSKGLVLVLHTPGGVTNAAETLVAYLRSKFDRLEVIVPTLAMSAGTMISLAADSIVMGRQSQLGPIDPQMTIGGRAISARAVVEQFQRAREDILGSPETGKHGDLLMAHVWAPVLATIGPALLQEAQNALDYSERMVARWLAAYMFEGEDEPEQKGAQIAAYFNDATQHKSHGRRLDREEARGVGVVVHDLEDSQELQEEVLTLYHLMTIVFQNSSATKVLESTTGGRWLKSWASPELLAQSPPQPSPPPPPQKLNRQQRRHPGR
jgi:ATP-dependent protease ClpP protease subunit